MGEEEPLPHDKPEEVQMLEDSQQESSSQRGNSNSRLALAMSLGRELLDLSLHNDRTAKRLPDVLSNEKSYEKFEEAKEALGDFLTGLAKAAISRETSSQGNYKREDSFRKNLHTSI